LRGRTTYWSSSALNDSATSRIQNEDTHPRSRDIRSHPAVIAHGQQLLSLHLRDGAHRTKPVDR
jgi:hypothetical protein